MKGIYLTLALTKTFVIAAEELVIADGIASR